MESSIETHQYEPKVKKLLPFIYTDKSEMNTL